MYQEKFFVGLGSFVTGCVFMYAGLVLQSQADGNRSKDDEDTMSWTLHLAIILGVAFTTWVCIHLVEMAYNQYVYSIYIGKISI